MCLQVQVVPESAMVQAMLGSISSQVVLLLTLQRKQQQRLAMSQQAEALESRPAMNDTTGFVVPLCLMKSAASSSAVPPISPIMMMPSVCTQRC